jgi:DNA-binding NtrC family response regulator
VLPVKIPALRERSADILPLAEHFLKVYARRNGINTPGLSEDAKNSLLSWNWPGNVRELENVIQRSVILLDGDTVNTSDLTFGPATGVQQALPQASEPSTPEESEAALSQRLAKLPMAEIERVAILATLECTGGNKTEAARRLGLTARTLSNKIKLWKSTGLLA